MSPLICNVVCSTYEYSINTLIFSYAVLVCLVLHIHSRMIRERREDVRVLLSYYYTIALGRE